MGYQTGLYREDTIWANPGGWVNLSHKGRSHKGSGVTKSHQGERMQKHGWDTSFEEDGLGISLERWAIKITYHH